MHIMEDDAAKYIFGVPFALSIGPQNCGNQALERYFRARADIAFPKDVKETFYFDRHFQRGPEFYVSHFSPEPRHRIAMELASTIFDHPNAPERVYDLLGPQVKLFCPLRHPVSRSRAVYAEYMNYGITHGSLEQAAHETPQIIFASHYAMHLERWFEKFGAQNIKLVFAEDMERDPESFFKRLCGFLSIPYQAPPNPSFKDRLKGVFGKRKKEPVISRQDMKWLEDNLRPEIRKLEKLTGSPIPAWNN